MSSYQKLSIREIFKLYTILDRSEASEIYLIDEVAKMMSSIDTEDFKEILKMIKGKTPKTPAQAALWFIEGLKAVEFFAFRDFMAELNGRR